jgi:hypothetical protein
MRVRAARGRQMSLVELILGVLAGWRVTHLLHAEDGPGRVLARWRRNLPAGFWSELMDCFYCLSLWISLPIALVLAGGWRARVLAWLAVSGGAILLQRATEPVAVPFVEDAPPAQDAP